MRTTKTILGAIGGTSAIAATALAFSASGPASPASAAVTSGPPSGFTGISGAPASLRSDEVSHIARAAASTGLAYDRVVATKQVDDPRGPFTVAISTGGACIVEPTGISCVNSEELERGQFVATEFAAPSSIKESLTSTTGTFRGVAPDGYVEAAGLGEGGREVKSVAVAGNTYVLEGKFEAIELRGGGRQLRVPVVH